MRTAVCATRFDPFDGRVHGAQLGSAFGRYEADSVVSCTSDLAESEASYDRDDGQRKQDAAKRRAHGNDKPKEYNKNKGK